MAARLTGSSAWSVGIVVPARNESILIVACVDSILEALRTADVDGWLVVVADSCTDDTALVARRRLCGVGEVAVVNSGTVGSARRVGVDLVLRHFAGRDQHMHNVWLMATDADSVVPENWVQAHLGAANAGMSAVAGPVRVGSFDEHPPQVPHRYAQHHDKQAQRNDPPVHGANFGVRADVYLDVGGWHSLESGEDRELWARLQETGQPLVSTIDAPVITSGRRLGRAPDGFAAFLTVLGSETVVEESS